MRLNQNDATLQCALDAAGLVVWDATVADGSVLDGEVFWSAAGASLLGLPAQSVVQSYRQFLAHVHPEHRDHVVETMQDAANRGDGYELEYRVMWADGSQHWLAVRAQIVTVVDDAAVRTFGIVSDVSARKEAESRLQAEKDKAEMTLRSIGDGVLTTDVRGIVSGMNRVAEQFTGWRSAEAIGRDAEQVFCIIDDVSAATHVIEATEATEAVRAAKPGAAAQATGSKGAEHPVRKCLRLDQTISASTHSVLMSRNGSRLALQQTAAPIRDGQGRSVGVVVVFQDVSYERQLRHELSWQASHDALTGLINRREFEFQVSAALARAKAGGAMHALLFLDLDHFKIVNDTCGHGAGDVLLQQLAGLLQAHMRDSDVLARLGGDELGVLLLDCPACQALALADQLREAIREYRFVWHRHSFEIGVCIGLVSIDEDSHSTSDLLAAADQACYVAKAQGRNRVHQYQEPALALATRQGGVQWAARLNQALEENRFELFMQPIVTLSGALGRHAEVLLRLRDEDDALVLPGAFVPAAERHHLMRAIDRWVIEAVCRQLATEGPPRHADATVLTLNLSSMSLIDERLPEFVGACLARYATPAARLCFEMREAAVLANPGKAKLFIERLRGSGVQFSLDGFGSGLSSFAYVKSLPVNFLKIDGLFVRDIVNNEVNRAMLAAINSVAHAMGMKTIAEHVETTEVLAAVTAIGIDFAQGYAIGGLQPLASGNRMAG